MLTYLAIIAYHYIKTRQEGEIMGKIISGVREESGEAVSGVVNNEGIIISVLRPGRTVKYILHNPGFMKTIIPDVAVFKGEKISGVIVERGMMKKFVCMLGDDGILVFIEDGEGVIKWFLNPGPTITIVPSFLRKQRIVSRNGHCLAK